MPDPLSPIQRVVMLRRIDPERGMARFYSLMIERDLFGTVRLVRHWGRIGSMQGRELAQDFPSEEEAAAALGRLAAVKRRRSYVDL
jgi:predicted DNA-binding WGR domain protein